MVMSNDRRAGAASAPKKQKWSDIEGSWRWLKNERRGIQHQVKVYKFYLDKAQSLFDHARVSPKGNDKDTSSRRLENIRECEAERNRAFDVHCVSQKKVHRLNEDGIVFRVNQPDYQLSSEGRTWNALLERWNPIFTAGMSVYIDWASSAAKMPL